MYDKILHNNAEGRPMVNPSFGQRYLRSISAPPRFRRTTSMSTLMSIFRSHAEKPAEWEELYQKEKRKAYAAEERLANMKNGVKALQRQLEEYERDRDRVAAFHTALRELVKKFFRL